MAHDERKLTRLNPQIEITHLKPDKRVGLLVVLTGYGKGKSSSALGMVLRACGHGMKVCMLQFMKGDIFTGEWEALQKIDCDVEIVPTGMGFCGIQGNPYSHAQHREAAQRALLMAKKRVISGKYGLIVLDEINNAVHLKLVDLEQVLDLLAQQAPPSAPHTDRPRRGPGGAGPGRHGERSKGAGPRLPQRHRAATRGGFLRK